jgi:hypothetical protein
MGPQNGGRYSQVVAIRRWSLAQVLQYFGVEDSAEAVVVVVVAVVVVVVVTHATRTKSTG